MPALITAQPVHFLGLQNAIFCAQCELISANSTPRCLACGSQAVLALARILGGSLCNQPTARLIEDDELNRLVGRLLDTISAEAHSEASKHLGLPARHHARLEASEPVRDGVLVPRIALEPAIGVIAERAQVLTGATGAAIALRKAMR
jgi:hypothetical protein